MNQRGWMLVGVAVVMLVSVAAYAQAGDGAVNGARQADVPGEWWRQVQKNIAAGKNPAVTCTDPQTPHRRTPPDAYASKITFPSLYSVSTCRSWPQLVDNSVSPMGYSRSC